jgi:photosystem II stability/assembly factor-like uncharacterized protein
MDLGLLISDDLGQTFRRSAEGMTMGGNCFGVVVDPKAPDTIWSATGWWNRNQGDLCRSDDGGKSWRVVGHPGSGLPDGQVLDMVLDSKSSVGQRRLLAAVNGHGCFETRNGGTSWHNINGDLPGNDTNAPVALLLDPTNSNHIIFAAAQGIHETRDGGRTWHRLHTADPFGNIKHLAADPRNFATLYVAARERYDQQSRRTYPGGAFRSEDGGRTWRRILDYHFAQCVAVSPADSRVVYVATADHPYHDDPIAEGLLKSADAGRSWRRENAGLSLLNIKAVSVSPHDPSILFLSSSGNSVFVGRDKAILRQQTN